MKQYSELELNRALRIQEADIISLEQKYMVQLTKLFQTKEFSKNLSELENYIQANYNFIKKRYSKKNKVDIAVERTCRFHVYTKYKEIIKIYPSPISSDIAFETKDAIINIDSKTIDKHKNSGDFNQRIQDNVKIEEFFTSDSILTIFSVLTLIIYSVILLYYDLYLFLIYFGLTVAAVYWSFFW